MDSGWECFIRARRGDKSAWRDLVDCHRPRLMSLALLITGSAADAEDIVQETFTRAIIAGARHYKSTLEKYLGTIAFRLSLKEKKRSNRQASLENFELADSAHNSLDSVILSERDRQIAAAIRTLDKKHRDVLVLRFYGNCSYEEIAELLEISSGTVKSRVFYAVKTCRKILKEKGIL